MPPSIKRHLELKGFEVVTPTPGLIRYWWVRCLREVFGYPPLASLVPCTVEVRRQRLEWAACHWPAQSANASLHVTHHDEPVSREGLLLIILHEIVHAILVHEDRHGDSLHGKNFMKFRKLVKSKTGLVLAPSFSRKDLGALIKHRGTTSD